MKSASCQYDLEFFTLDIDFEYTSGTPEVVNKLPENCHPAEDPEIYISKISIGGIDVTEVTNDYCHSTFEDVCLTYLEEEFGE